MTAYRPLFLNRREFLSLCALLPIMCSLLIKLTIISNVELGEIVAMQIWYKKVLQPYWVGAFLEVTSRFALFLKCRKYPALRKEVEQLLSARGKDVNQSGCASNTCICYVLFSFASKFMRRSRGIIMDFWWNGPKGDQKNLLWQTLCKLKSKGGLGFASSGLSTWPFLQNKCVEF